MSDFSWTGKWFFEDGVSAQGVAMISAFFSALAMILWNVVKWVYARLTRPHPYVAEVLALMQDADQWVPYYYDEFRHKTKNVELDPGSCWGPRPKVRVNGHDLYAGSGFMDRARLRAGIRKLSKAYAKAQLAQAMTGLHEEKKS